MKGILIAGMIAFVTSNMAVLQPAIHAPRDGQRIGAAGDDACPAAKKDCWRISASGVVPAKRVGIFAVEPLEASPDIWIQSFSPTAEGGKVTTTIRLGEVHAGAGEDFRIYLLACKPKHGLKRKEITTIETLRKKCAVSTPVTVHRVR